MKIDYENMIKVSVSNWLVFIVIIIVANASMIAARGIDLTDNTVANQAISNISTEVYNETQKVATNLGGVQLEQDALNSQYISINYSKYMREEVNENQFDATEGSINILGVIGQMISWLIQSQIPVISLYSVTVGQIGTPFLQLIVFLFLIGWQLVIVYHWLAFVFGYRLKG